MQDSNVRLTTVPWKTWSDQKLYLYVFVSLGCLISFAVSLRKWHAQLLLIRSNGETCRNKNFSRQKYDHIFHISIRLGFQGYFWRSGIFIFAWRVTWNYAYSSFKASVQPIFTGLFSKLAFDISHGHFEIKTRLSKSFSKYSKHTMILN